MLRLYGLKPLACAILNILYLSQYLSVCNCRHAVFVRPKASRLCIASKLKARNLIYCLTCNKRATIHGVCCSNSLAHAERRSALTVLDYALSSGLDSASRTKVEVEATIKQTSEQVSSVPCASATCDVGHDKRCLCFCPPPSSLDRFVQTHKWYMFEYSTCQAQLTYIDNSIQAPCLYI